MTLSESPAMIALLASTSRNVRVLELAHALHMAKDSSSIIQQAQFEVYSMRPAEGAGEMERLHTRLNARILALVAPTAPSSSSSSSSTSLATGACASARRGLLCAAHQLQPDLSVSTTTPLQYTVADLARHRSFAGYLAAHNVKNVTGAHGGKSEAERRAWAGIAPAICNVLRTTHHTRLQKHDVVPALADAWIAGWKSDHGLRTLTAAAVNDVVAAARARAAATVCTAGTAGAAGAASGRAADHKALPLLNMFSSTPDDDDDDDSGGDDQNSIGSGEDNNEVNIDDNESVITMLHNLRNMLAARHGIAERHELEPVPMLEQWGASPTSQRHAPHRSREYHRDGATTPPMVPPGSFRADTESFHGSSRVTLRGTRQRQQASAPLCNIPPPLPPRTFQGMQSSQ